MPSELVAAALLLLLWSEADYLATQLKQINATAP